MATKPMVGVSGQAWQAANADDNCGTGAGGFQPGNTCAKGDGSGGEAPLNRVQRPPLPRKETASFDAAAWAAKPVPDRVKEWSAMGQAKRDELADAANSVPARRKELLAPLGERPASTGDAKADAKARVAQASEHVTRYAAAKIEKQAGRYADLLGEAGIEGEQAATLVAHATDELLAQEMEGMRRQLGDHGISHIGGNIERGLSILDAVPGDHTPQDRLQIVISNIYHDTGYMTGPSRTFLDEGHPRWSAEHYNNEVKPMVKAALGSRVANEIEHDIRTHADTSINWQEDAAGSAVRVADNTGLFQRDKLPPLFRHAPKNIEVLGRLSRKEMGLDEARAEMQANVAAAKLPEPVEAALGEAVKEVGPMTGKFTLGMLGGHIEKVRWAGDHVAIDLSEDKALTELHKIGDFGQRQFGKFAESYGQDPEAFKNSLEFTFRDRAGNPLLSSRVVKGAANSRVGVSGHYWTLANGNGQPCGDSFIAADKTCQVGVTKESRVSAAASRFRPREEVRFSPTLKGPNGAELTAYEWKWMPEEYVKKNGDDGVRRVSNWEEAEESTDTGRNIVHQFVVKTADGQNHLVSSESVPQMLGFVAKGQGTRLPSLVSGAKTLAKIQMKIAVTEAQHAENERIEKEVKALHLPDITSYPAIREVGSDKGKPYGTVWKMDDAKVLEHAHREGQTEVLPTRISQERRETLEWVWRTNRQKERGWERPREDLRSLRMRAKRQEAKLNAITAPAANCRVSVGGYVWQPLEMVNADGQACGESFISGDKTCRIGEAAETPEQKQARVKAWNDKHSEVVKATGRDAWSVVEDVMKVKGDAEQMAAMDKMIADHGDKPKAWEPDNLMPMAEFETGDWETREQEAERRKFWVAFNEARTKVRDELVESDLPNEKKRDYLNDAQYVLAYMPRPAVEAFNQNVEQIKFHKDVASLTEAVNKMAKEGDKRQRVGGCWVGNPYSPKGTLHLDGGDSLDGRGIYAHEFGHACDYATVKDPNDEEDTGAGHRISWEPGWREAHAAEIKTGNLSKYATTSPTEGFAEFARLCWTGERPKSIAAEYPKCYAVFKKHGLIQ